VKESIIRKLTMDGISPTWVSEVASNVSYVLLGKLYQCTVNGTTPQF